MADPPILVTGSHRSGTTWVGAMLAGSGAALAIHEPFNPTLDVSWLRHRADHWFTYVGAENAAEFRPDVERILQLRPPVVDMLRRDPSPGGVARAGREQGRAWRGRMTHARPLIKDPLAFFAAEWLASEFGAQTVVMVRHPAAFAGSLQRLGWAFDFRNLSAQPLLVERYLPDFRSELDEAVARPPEAIIDQAILLWRMLTTVALRYARDHPDWAIIRYEDLARDPEPGFGALYARLGLDWNNRVANTVRRHSDTTNPTHVLDTGKGGIARDSARSVWTWTERLSADDIDQIRRGTRDVAPLVYSDDDWTAPVSHHG